MRCAGMSVPDVLELHPPEAGLVGDGSPGPGARRVAQLAEHQLGSVPSVAYGVESHQEALRDRRKAQRGRSQQARKRPTRRAPQ